MLSEYFASVGQEQNEDRLNVKLRLIRVRRAALGFRRSYSFLLRFESDLRIAVDAKHSLVPDRKSWARTCAFLSCTNSISDLAASTRFCYGELRLSRLNLYAPILLYKSNCQRVEYQINAYFARFYAPILFTFGVISVVLNGMQVVVTVEQIHVPQTTQTTEEQLGNGDSNILVTKTMAFGYTVVVLALLVLVLLFVVWLVRFVKEWTYACKDWVFRIQRSRKYPEVLEAIEGRKKSKLIMMHICLLYRHAQRA